MSAIKYLAIYLVARSYLYCNQTSDKETDATPVLIEADLEKT
jgi:hypothetical protein